MRANGACALVGQEGAPVALGGAELPSRKNLDQFLRKMATYRFQVFGRIAGQQNAGPFANFTDAPEFVEEFQNYLGMKRWTELIAEAPQRTRSIITCVPARQGVWKPLGRGPAA
jgi:hypothetical protein